MQPLNVLNPQNKPIKHSNSEWWRHDFLMWVYRPKGKKNWLVAKFLKIWKKDILSFLLFLKLNLWLLNRGGCLPFLQTLHLPLSWLSKQKDWCKFLMFHLSWTTQSIQPSKWNVWDINGLKKWGSILDGPGCIKRTGHTFSNTTRKSPEESFWRLFCILLHSWTHPT